jgi:ADP-ribose pyrophosphatase
LYLEDGGVEVIRLETDLAEGSLKSARAKFAKANQPALIESLIRELEDGTLYRGEWRKGEIEIVGIQKIISNRFWTEVEYNVLFPPRLAGGDPAKGTYRSIVWNSGPAAGAGALLITKDREVVLLRSFRHAVRRWTLELPRGIKKPDESYEECAIREAQEECGAMLTESSSVIDFGVHEPDTGVLRQEAHIMCVTNVEINEEKVSRDVSESVMQPVVVTLEKFREMVVAGEVRDGWIISAVFQAQVRGLL